MMQALSPELLLRAYSAGIFPMADSADAPDIYWVEPKKRGIFPIASFQPARSVLRRLRNSDLTHRINTDFEGVMRACAAPAPGREETWINPLIIAAYSALHAQGRAHSVEVWQGDVLVGGLYGVHIGGAFFGESMFSLVRDASKCALAHLMLRLRVGGFTLCDTQFLTPHLASLGAIEISRADYRARLEAALGLSGDFGALDALLAAEAPLPATMVSGPISGKRIAQRITQTS